MSNTNINLVMAEMIRYYSGDPKRIQHFIKVHALAHSIAVGEGVNEELLYTLDIASLVHDIGIKLSEQKYNSSAGKYQEIEGPAEAEKLLTPLGIDKKIIDRVCYLVGHHHTYDNIDGLDYQILVEADFLVNIYEDNLSKSAAKSACEHIFCTKTGKQYLFLMYNV
jgi:hypothetical protein